LGFAGKGLPFLFTAALAITISTEILTKSYNLFLAYYKSHKQKGQYNESNNNNNINNGYFSLYLHYCTSGHITGYTVHKPGSNIVPKAHHGITSIFLARSLIYCDWLLNSRLFLRKPLPMRVNETCRFTRQRLFTYLSNRYQIDYNRYLARGDITVMLD
jgi:hypothetical protein